MNERGDVVSREEQRRAGVSRGALLHHFPTHEDLLAAAVGLLVERNEEAVRKEPAVTAPGKERLSRSLRVLGSLLRSPSYGAELELWAVARTNPRLREVLRRAEGAVRRDLYRVLGDVLGPEATAAPGYPLVAELTVQLLRGMAISEVLHRDDAGREALLERWGQIADSLLAAAPPAPSAPTGEEEPR
ncbi:TetR/AcrR family transcriptional regulator [Nonomuraea sp. SYSU D8015]|uniref:TetR/AcrR family transcriptional regulator n=1 Tax=Nonomuraea sp. SYSU D8015 TaxID=2593644 RepID=UPI00166133A4|nr:TetR/AcrR family transcriptional regulator [Nonomuraea sp. SYSU D8015]